MKLMRCCACKSTIAGCSRHCYQHITSSSPAISVAMNHLQANIKSRCQCLFLQVFKTNSWSLINILHY